MNPVAISFSPNTDFKDVSIAARAFVMGRRKDGDEILKNVERQISGVMQGRSVILASSGRQALMDILLAVGIGRGDEVILQAFTCIAVPESILWTGATPIFADIDPTTYNASIESIRSKITDKTKAIIIQHTFGIPGPITEVVSLAREHNLLLIEDCAVAFGGMHDGQALGTFGDAAIVSFGRDKMVSSVFGGAAISSQSTIIRQLRTLQDSRSNPSPFWVRKQLFHPVLFAAALPIYTFGIGKVFVWLAQTLGLLSRAYEPQEKQGRKPSHLAWKYSPALAYLAQHQLKKFAGMVARRRAIAHRYHNALQHSGIRLPKVSAMSEPAWLRFPIWISNKQEFLTQARKRNIFLGDWYDGPLMPSGVSPEVFGYMKGSCPNAEEAANHVINLPTYPRLTDSQVEAVIEFVKEYAN